MRDGDARGERKLLACLPRAPLFSSSTYYAGYPRCDSLFMFLTITFHTAFFIASIRSTDRKTGHRLQVNEFY